MLSQVHFATAVLWLSAGIAGLLWVMACALTANKMEREGAPFWKGFLTCFLLTPLVGLLVIGVAWLIRSNRPLVGTVTRG
jgi:hypothetical protein